MRTVEKIERKGYKVSFYLSGRGVEAVKGSLRLVAPNITQLYKKITGK